MDRDVLFLWLIRPRDLHAPIAKLWANTFGINHWNYDYDFRDILYQHSVIPSQACRGLRHWNWLCFTNDFPQRRQYCSPETIKARLGISPCCINWQL